MIPINSLEGKVTKLERQRKAHICFEMIEEYWPGNECFGACDFSLKRNGVPTFRWPKKFNPEEWLNRYSPLNSKSDP